MYYQNHKTIGSEYNIVLLGLLIYVLYVLIPLIPAVIIYKLFPKTTVGASGFLGNIKINATGAFGAYVITVILGHFIIEQNLEILYRLDSTAWEIESRVNFVDCDQNPLNGFTDSDVRSKLEIRTTPDYSQKTMSGIVFMAYVRGLLPKITFSYPGFQSRMIDLEGDENITRDYSKRKIDLGSINLRRCDQPYAFEETEENDSIVTSIPSSTSGGPPIGNHENPQ